LFRADKSPDFVDLQFFAGEVLKNTILIPSRRMSRIDNQFAHRRLAEARQESNGADRHALAKEMNDPSAFCFLQLVHTGHYA